MPAYSDRPRVVTFAPDGTDPRWLGSLGFFTQLTYDFALPGGPNQLGGILQRRPNSHPRSLDAGRRVKVYRGAVCVWDGKMDEAAPSDAGWTVAAHGAGTFGTDFEAYYTGSYTQDGPITAAISRGMRWINPGISGGSVFMPATPPDPASITITDHLNNITSPAGTVWYVGQNNVLSVYTPAWSTPNRILISTAPPPRTLFGYPTVIYARYQVTADSPTSGAGATFGTTSVTNTANATKHGNMEAYIDLTAAGTLTQTAAQNVIKAVLAKYIAAAYGGSFTVRRGQLLTMGGAAVDLAAQTAGIVCQLQFAAGGYGGEIVPALPVTFLAGSYAYDDVTQTATISPYQSALFDLGGLLSNWVTMHTPVAAA